jgi:hypothetical protein
MLPSAKAVALVRMVPFRSFFLNALFGVRVADALPWIAPWPVERHGDYTDAPRQLFAGRVIVGSLTVAVAASFLCSKVAFFLSFGSVSFASDFSLALLFLCSLLFLLVFSQFFLRFSPSEPVLRMA